MTFDTDVDVRAVAALIGCAGTKNKSPVVLEIDVSSDYLA